MKKTLCFTKKVKVYGFYIVIKIVPIIMIKIIHAKGYRCLETALVFQLKNNILSIYMQCIFRCLMHAQFYCQVASLWDKETKAKKKKKYYL